MAPCPCVSDFFGAGRERQGKITEIFAAGFINLGALWQSFSKCFSIGFYRSPAKPLTK
jgi:hypothetical protein